MQASRSAAHAMVDTFLAPTAAFTALRNRPAWAWIALGLIAVVSAISILLFMGGMSPEWIVEQQLLSDTSLSVNERADARGTLLEIAPYTAMIGAVFSVIVLPIIAALLGLAYFLAERVLARQRNGYGQWFSAAAFSMLPLALGSLGLIALRLLNSEPNLPLEMAQFSSLNNLWLGLAPGEPGYALAGSANVLYLWCAFLAAIAARVWSELDWSRALLLGALPYILVFGAWFAFV